MNFTFNIIMFEMFWNITTREAYKKSTEKFDLLGAKMVNISFEFRKKEKNHIF